MKTGSGAVSIAGNRDQLNHSRYDLSGHRGGNRVGPEHVNQRLTDREEQALARSIQRGAPFGDDAWAKTVKPRNLESTIKARGRPLKIKSGSYYLAYEQYVLNVHPRWRR